METSKTSLLERRLATGSPGEGVKPGGGFGQPVCSALWGRGRGGRGGGGRLGLIQATGKAGVQ